ncbi:unnamed protein product [Rhodiola kirilowii]
MPGDCSISNMASFNAKTNSSCQRPRSVHDSIEQEHWLQ